MHGIRFLGQFRDQFGRASLNDNPGIIPTLVHVNGVQEHVDKAHELPIVGKQGYLFHEDISCAVLDFFPRNAITRTIFYDLIDFFLRVLGQVNDFNEA
jgi:hypothetical protein